MSGCMHPRANALLTKLWPDHLIRTLMDEHQVLLRSLARIETLVGEWEKSGDRETLLAELAVQAELLLEADSHHQREEAVLFPAMENAGVEGPPQVMRQEHEELRAAKRQLHQLCGEKISDDLGDLLLRTGIYLVHSLRDHISKEDNVLYPLALENIESEDAWNDMKSRCDEIGYCSFTPGKRP